MLSGQIYDFLKEHLDRFLFNFDQKQLSMSLLSGSLTLSDVNLRPEAINDLFSLNKIPLTLKAGLIGKLSISFSMLSFYTKPITISFENLNIVFGPSTEHMSRETSFFYKNQTRRVVYNRNNNNESESDVEEIDSSYDSTNAFNVFQHEIKAKDQMRQRANEARKWTPQHFLDTLKGLHERMNQSNSGISGRQTNDFDFDMSSFQGKAPGLTGESQADKDREMFRSLLAQIQIDISQVHIRYEDDMFCEEMPYSLGLIAEHVECVRAEVGKETWQFQEFISRIFQRKSCENIQNQSGKSLEPWEILFKEFKAQKCQIYINGQSETYIPQNMYEETKHFDNQIFEVLPANVLLELMQKRIGLNFIAKQFDFVANIGDINSQKFYFNIVCDPIDLKMDPNSINCIYQMLEFQEFFKIVPDLKMYRPQRRPLLSTEFQRQINKKSKLQNIQQAMPENSRQKRRLIIRDWFFYVIWFVRIRRLYRSLVFSQAKSQMSYYDKDQMKGLIEAASKGMNHAKEFLQKQQIQRRQNVNERAKYASVYKQISQQKYKFAQVTIKLQSFRTQFFEKNIDSETKNFQTIPLIDFSIQDFAFEKRLDQNVQKIENHLACGSIQLRQQLFQDICPSKTIYQESGVQMTKQNQFGTKMHKIEQNNSLLGNILGTQFRQKIYESTTQSLYGSDLQVPSASAEQNPNNVRKPTLVSQLSTGSFTSIRRPQTELGLSAILEGSNMTGQNIKIKAPGALKQQSVSKWDNVQQPILAKKQDSPQSDPYEETQKESKQPTSSFLGIFASFLSSASSVAKIEPPPKQPLKVNSQDSFSTNQSLSKTQTQQQQSDRNQIVQLAKRNDYVPQIGPKTYSQKLNNPNPYSQSAYSSSAINSQQYGFQMNKNDPRLKKQVHLKRPTSSQQRINFNKRNTFQHNLTTQKNRVSINHLAQSNARNQHMATKQSEYSGSIFGSIPPQNQQNNERNHSPIRQEDGVYRGKKQLSLIDIRPMGGGRNQAGLDIVVQFPRLSQIESMCPLGSQPSSMINLVKKVQVGQIYMDQIHSQQLLKVIQKLLSSYSSRIVDILCLTKTFETLIDENGIQSLQDLGRNVQEKYVPAVVFTNYLIKLTEECAQNQSSSSISPLLTESIKQNEATFAKNAILTGEENLTEEIQTNQLGHQRRQQTIENRITRRLHTSERLQSDDTQALLALINMIPENHFDFAYLIAVQSSKIAIFCDDVPVFKMNVQDPINWQMGQSHGISEMKLGSIESTFISSAELIFAFAKSFNAALQPILQNPLIKRDRSICQIQKLVQEHFAKERRLRKIVAQRFANKANKSGNNQKFVDQKGSDQQLLEVCPSNGSFWDKMPADNYNVVFQYLDTEQGADILTDTQRVSSQRRITAQAAAAAESERNKKQIQKPFDNPEMHLDLAQNSSKFVRESNEESRLQAKKINLEGMQPAKSSSAFMSPAAISTGRVVVGFSKEKGIFEGNRITSSQKAKRGPNSWTSQSLGSPLVDGIGSEQTETRQGNQAFSKRNQSNENEYGKQLIQDGQKRDLIQLIIEDKKQKGLNIQNDNDAEEKKKNILRQISMSSDVANVDEFEDQNGVRRAITNPNRQIFGYDVINQRDFSKNRLSNANKPINEQANGTSSIFADQTPKASTVARKKSLLRKQSSGAICNSPNGSQRGVRPPLKSQTTKLNQNRLTGLQKTGNFMQKDLKRAEIIQCEPDHIQNEEGGTPGYQVYANARKATGIFSNKNQSN